MMTKSEAISRLSLDFNKNCNLIEVLKHDSSSVLICGEDGCFVVKNCDGIYLFSVEDFALAKPIIDAIDGLKVAMSTDLETALYLKERFSIKSFKRCYQVLWNKKEKIPESHDLTIDKLECTDYNIKAISSTYRGNLDFDEVASLMKRHGFLGAYVDGELAGYISWHSELTMGLLEVFKKYRRSGIGTALAMACVNQTLDLGRLPFHHVVDSNERSINLSKKMGFTFYDGFVYWVG